MKKYFSLFLIALMAVSVVSAAGVVSAKKPGAAPTTIVVPYAAGTTATITPKQFNEHATYKSLYQTTKAPQILVSSKGSTASTSIKITSPSTSSYSYADVGANVGITGAPADAKVTVTTQVKRTMSASGADYNTNAWVVVNFGLPIWDPVTIYAGDPAVSETVPYTFTGLLGDFFSYDATTGTYSGSIDAHAGCQVVDEITPAQASATAEFSSIVIQFL